MEAIKLNRRELLRGAPAALLLPALAGAAAGNLLLPERAEAVLISGVTGVVYVPGGYLNVRTGPSAGHAVLARANHGSTLAILQTSSDWFKVNAGGTIGWVDSRYVSVNGNPSVLIRRGQEWRPRIALTFDAGADLGYTEKILNTLSRYRVKASFGLTGSWAKKFPGYVRWMVADGHQLINHTLNHVSFTGQSTGAGPASPAKRIAQVLATEEALIGIAGVGAGAYWRPPYGDYDAATLREMGAIGRSRTVMWSVDSLGWAGYSASQIYDRVVGGANNGGIILFHVGAASQDGNALESIIQRLKSDGYQFGTVRQTYR